jgi:hypothetical protein
VVLRPLRARCGSCAVTHVLLRVSCLLRRADGVDVIGACGGRGPVLGIGRSRSGWVGRWRRAGLAARVRNHAQAVRSVFTALLVGLDPLTGPLPSHPSLFADAVEVIGGCAGAARRRLGVVGAVSPWQLAAAVTNGRLLVAAATSRS